MSGRIPPAFIDELLRRTDLVELIHARLPLKRVGSNYQALCPFHQEKSPSFSVTPDKQLYHCFGCGASGTAITFLMEYENLGFLEAIEELAQRVGLEIPTSGTPAAQEQQPLYTVLEQAASYFQQWLQHPPQAAPATHYLQQRGLHESIIQEYRLGYVPPGWDNLKRVMVSSPTPTAAQSLVAAGLLIEKEVGGHSYDRFRERIIFPIRDLRGRVIGFGGRVMGDEKPKYLNSPETPLFHKGKELYGLYEARQAQRRLESILVVEGYMDVIALAQHGLRNCVATLGTATTSDHLERLFRLVREITFCFDGDHAGREAAWKALQTALPQMQDGRDIRFLFLPEGEDPDSFLRKQGRAALEQQLANAIPLSRFLFQRLEQACDPSTPEGQAKLAKSAQPLLARLPQGVYRELLQRQLTQQVGTVVTIPSGPPAPARPAPRPPLRPRQQATAEGRLTLLPQRAIRCLLQHPDAAHQPDLAEEWRNLEEPGITLLAQLLDLIRNHPGINTAGVLTLWGERDPHHAATLQALVTQELPLPPEALAAEFRDALQRMEERSHKLERDRILEEQIQKWGRERGKREPPHYQVGDEPPPIDER